MSASIGAVRSAASVSAIASASSVEITDQADLDPDRREPTAELA
ncbi:hypothetical protein [Novosphingobium sp. 9U]|nr:hypothetical protein [Novosphingobium sp. 9U]